MFDKSELFGAKSKAGRAAAVVSFVALLAFFSGPFYWPDSNAALATFIRLTVLLGVVLYSIDGWSRKQVNSVWITAGIFFSYFLLNALLLGEDLQSARRLVLIGFFVVMVARFWAEPVLPRYLLGSVALIGAFFSTFSLLNLNSLDLLDLSYRGRGVYSSGVPGLADFGNTIVAAMHYACCYCAALWMLLNSRNRYLSAMWMLCLGVMGFYIVFTFARTAWVACLIISVTLLLLSVRRSSWRRAVPIGIAIVCLLLWFALNHLGYELKVRGLSSREDIWMIVLSRVEDRPWLGFGGGAPLDPIPLGGGKWLINTAHSAYLETLYQFGVVGLFLMLVLIVVALVNLFRSARSERHMSARDVGLAMLGAATIVMLVELNGLVDSPNLLWIWFWLPIGIAMSREGEGCAEYST